MNKDSFTGRGFSGQKLALLASMLQEEGVPQASSLKRIPRDNELPLSPAQTGLWLLDQLEPGSAAYNIPVRHDLRGHFDLAAFERSLSEIVRRHEVLRTYYLRVDGRPVQKIAPPELFRIPIVDLQGLPEAARQREVVSLAATEAGLAFDLGEPPLIRARLLKLGPDEHVLLLNFHHIAFDGWSYGVFEKELAALYDAFLGGGKASPLPELPLQYVDFAAWQRQWLQGEILQEQLDYWQKKLCGTIPVLDLPTDRPRPAVQTYNGSISCSVLSQKLTEALKILSQREGVTLFATLLGTFKVLLQRYTGQDDILVGAAISGRNQAEIEGLLGFFVNTLVMRTDLSGDPTFRQLLRRLKETTLGAYAHQDLPFEKLVEVLNPARNASHSPMFQVMLSMLNMPMEPWSLPGLRHERKMIDSGTSKFDLTLYVMEEPQGLTFICEYNTDLFNRDRIERMLGHLAILLEGAVADPDRRLSELPLLTAEERKQSLIGWNDTRVAYPQDALLHELFEAQVERTPEAVAVEYDGQRLSYGELDRRSNQLAHELRSLGVGPEVLVGLCVERSLEMVVGLLGILKAGGAYVPLDPSFPQARLAYMIADSGMPVLVTHRQLDQKLPVLPSSILHLDSDWEAIARQETTDAGLPTAQPENLAYVLYTSGSTGKPKGVAIPHAAVVNFLRSMQREPGFSAEDRLLAVTTLSFDIAGLELYLPLVTGGTTIIASREDNYDPARLMARIEQSQCTVMQATPATWRALFEAGWEGSKNLKLLCGGEALPGDLAAALLPRCAELWNMYGPTETTIWSTLHRVRSADGPVPIGRPIANTQVFILDGHRQLVPPGIVGELYIGGSGLARGYLARPELTAERFVESPFAPNARLYRTGDRARWLADGTLECLGRVDQQVKIRGFRIEPGEVESALARHAAVGQCVVVACDDSRGERILVAYLEPQPDQPAPQVSDLRAHLASDLPAYMVPSAFVILHKLPLTPNGKIDRNSLPAPSFDPVRAAHESLAPRTETEQALAAIWSEVLKVGSIGIQDNFFDLGGHSLLVIRAVSRIRDVFEVDLLPSSFFAHPTVAGLARVLAEDKGEGEGIQRIERRHQDGPCSLSYAQERLWFLDQLAPGSPLYNIVDVVAFEGNYNAEAMQRAVNELVRRHETLRTAFSSREGQPVQIVLPTVDLAFPELDLRQLPEKEREETWIRWAREEGRKPFHLAQPPLLRGTLVRLSEQKQLLLLTIHHIIADEWSMEVLQRELQQIYRAFCQGEPSPLPELPIRYTDFVHWQRGYLQGEVLRKQAAFWKDELAGAPTILELPTDKPRPAVQSFQGATEAFELPRELLERLKLLSRQQDATLFMTLAAAFMVLLHRYTGQDDILVGTPISGRTRSETEDLIGLFLNLVILRAQFSEEGTFQSLLHQVRQRALGAYGHQDLPFEQLVAELTPERDLSRTPLFQVMFVLFSTDAASQASDAAGLAQLATGTSKFDLTLAVSETEAGLKGIIEYRTDLFEAGTIRRLCRHYGTLLDAISRDPDQIVSALPILADTERQQLLLDWNNTAVAQPENDLCLHPMIAEQARQNPDQVALLFQEQQEEQRLSYGELDRRSNQLAHELRSLGVGPEVLVGLCVERSLEMVVGLLGILKAGGAYVPLDPSFPQARLAYMIADSGMPVLVTHRQLDQKLPVLPSSILHLDSDWEAIARQETTDAGLPTAQPENLAYVLYTSGSTGKPKGVAIPHAAVVNFLRSMQREPGFSAEDRLLAVTTLSFDIAGLELYLPLVTGGTTIIASREDNYDPARLMARIEQSQCTVMQATPATWRALFEAGWEGSKNLKLLCGGEALPGDLAAALLPRCAELWNMYGPTETTIWSTLHRVRSADGPVPIGRPIANTQVFILDGHRQLVPPGIVGELYIGGSGLARGYLARPELTAERFVESPFAPNARLYRTGDRARWLADGTLECLGRVDQQVKIRGFRIEPGEVESALARHAAVGQCVVVACDDSRGERILVAYLEPQPDQPAPQVSDLRAHLASDLPAYMVPSAFVILHKLPLTPNGKIDRNSLPAPSFDPVRAAHESLAPRTETEQALAAIWSEVLKVGSIGIQDNFFDLGGHSLLVIRAVSRIRDVFEVDLLPSSFFAHPTVAGLARVLAEDKGEGEGIQRIERRHQDGPCSLSYAQERLWFLDQLAPGSPLYNIVDVVAFEGNYNAEAMQRAVNELVRRHETLRTAFSSREGQPVQIVLPTVDLAFPELDLRQLPEKEREETWIRWAREEGRKPFHLAQPPLLRGTLVRLSEQKQLLLLTIHHIIADEWSMEVLQRELQQIYRAFCQGEPSPLPELPIRYTDFVHWQRGYLQGEVLRKQAAFWKDELAGAPTILELPTDKPRPAVQSFQGATEAFELPRELLERLKLLSRQQDATLFMTLAAAFMVLLHRYTGQDDILVGTPISGRTRSETEDLIGLFLNLVILRAQFSEEGTFQSLLHQVRQRALGAYGHQDLPFEQLVAELTPERDLSRTPLFQVMFVLFSTDAASQASDAAGLAQLATGTSKFDLTLAVSETEAGLKGIIEYRTDLFEAGTIRRLCRHYGTLLDAISRDPDQIVSALPILADTERQQLLLDWNNTGVAYPQDALLHELFEAQVDRSPEAVAVEYVSKQLTYCELNQRANQLAHYLRTLAVGPDTLVGVCMERSLEMVVALYGILKAGGAYVPIDPEYPQERIGYMLEDAGFSVLLTQRRVLGRLPACSAKTLCLDDGWDQIAGKETANPARVTTPSNLAYMIYTSGSTGKPKGAMNTHRAICNRLLWMQNQYQLTPVDRILQKTPASFDVSVWEFFWPLLTGARLVVARPGGHQDPSYLTSLITSRNITVAHFVPSMLAVFLAEPGARGCASLRHVICSGEALPFNLQEQFFKLLRAQLHNLYGPTEAAVDVTHWTCKRNYGRNLVPIGRPVANTQIYILDKCFQPVPIGVPGDLYIGGVQVGRGYHNRPELTAEKFVQDPFNPDTEARLYKTGDVCRWLPDGNIEYLGRSDFQVKVRGLRIELGEIEAVLNRHEAVRQCVVVARDDARGERILAAYLETQPDTAPPAVCDLRAHLANDLPAYMVPSAFVVLDKLPLTPNGKIDRRALPAPTYDALAMSHPALAPSTETEKALAAIWCEVLKVERVGLDNNFFELGGHSLLAVTVIERMRRLGLQVEVRTLFANPRLADLAATIDADAPAVQVPENLIPAECTRITPQMLSLVKLTQEEIDRIVSAVPGGAANVQDIYLLAPLQEGILFHHLMATDGDPYLLSQLMSFESRTRLDRYVKAMQAVIDRHDILRTAVMWDGLSEPVQVVWRKAIQSVEELEFDPAMGEVAEQLWAKCDPRHNKLDVRRAPMLGMFVAHDPVHERWLLQGWYHHLMVDHTTLEVMKEEIQAQLLERAEELPVPLPFRNLVAQARLGVSQEEHEAFFRELLGDVEEPTAPFGLLDVQRDGSGIEEAKVGLEEGLAEGLRSHARRLGVSAASIFHLAWAQVLAKATGREDVAFGTVLFGRMQGGEGADRVMGPFINTLPVRIRIGDEGVEASIRQTHRLLADLLRHEHASLALAQRCSAVPAPMPLFSTLLNYRHSPGGVRVATKEELKAWEGIEELRAEERTNYPFMLSVDDLGKGFSLDAQTPVSIGAMRVCEYMRTALVGLVDALEGSPTRAICSLDVMPADEKRRVLCEWNDTAVAHPEKDLCVHHMIAEQARQNPDQVALICEEQQFTYRELNQRANQLAHQLRSLEVGPGVLVGLCVERSLEMVVGLLGILKAGGAYVPLDPAFPQARLAYMIADSGMRVLVTHRQLDQKLGVRPPSIVHLDSDWEAIARQDMTDAGLPPVQPENLAYVLYTSGSTGQPKGVEIPHSALGNFLRSMQREPGFTAHDGLLAVTTLSFDIAGLELYLPLVTGGTTIIASREEQYDPARLMARIQQSQCTVMQATPATWRALFEAGWEGSKNLKLLCGGEALPGDLAAALLPRCAELWNMYGPTETTIWSTLHRVRSADGPVPIGRPIANTQVFILDGHRQLVPPGIVGELYIGGSGLARGYLARPELTAERFVESPFAPNARLYRTGDRARWLADGTLECLGRVDQQVKIRGFRIEPGEVESALARHAAVGQCVVVAREDSNGDKILAAYLEAQPGQPAPQVSDLRAHLANDLPAYMVPSAFVVLDQLPLTPNGKIDRNALPAPNQEYIEVSGKIAAPRDAIEQMLAQIWSRILRVGSIGIHDNFFDLGGHSLLAVRIMAEVERLVKKRLPLATFLQAPTISDLANLLRRENWSPCWSLLTPLRAGGSRPPLFLMHSHGGNVLEYYPLARYLEADQPVFALQARGLDGNIIKDQSFEDMVKAYLAELRSLQPVGPYFLGGYCLGGLLALEAAQQLSAAGEEVALVVLIQAVNPTYAHFKPDLTMLQRGWYRATKRIDLELEYLRQRGAHHILERCRRTWDIACVRTAIKFDNWARNGHSQQKRRSMAYTLEMLASEHDKARVRYVPRPYNGPVTLFRASKQLSGLMTDYTLGWKAVLNGNLEICEVPGHQETMLSEPNVSHLAEKLTAQLQAVQESRVTAQLVVDSAYSVR